MNPLIKNIKHTKIPSQWFQMIYSNDSTNTQCIECAFHFHLWLWFWPPAECASIPVPSRFSLWAELAGWLAGGQEEVWTFRSDCMPTWHIASEGCEGLLQFLDRLRWVSASRTVIYIRERKTKEHPKRKEKKPLLTEARAHQKSPGAYAIVMAEEIPLPFRSQGHSTIST